MNVSAGAKANELKFQNDMLKHLVANGWLQGKTEHYNRELALYPEDLLGFVPDTQLGQWQIFCALYPSHPKQHFLECFASRANNTNPKAGSAMGAFFSAPALGRCEPAKALAA